MITKNTASPVLPAYKEYAAYATAVRDAHNLNCLCSRSDGSGVFSISSLAVSSVMSGDPLGSFSRAMVRRPRIEAEENARKILGVEIPLVYEGSTSERKPLKL
jgi:hypothetical protein